MNNIYLNLGNKKVFPVGNVDCYCSVSTGLFISKDGKTVALYHYGKPGNTLTVLQDASGPYVINESGKRIDIAYAVADACLFPYVGDGPKKVKYLDGDVMNTDADNLMWLPDLSSYAQTGVPLKRVEWMGKSVTVLRTGEVKLDGNTLPIEDHYHDGPTDCDRFVQKAFVVVDKLNLPVDDLMAVAGFVGGDPTQMVGPKVLHKDHDMLNFKADNLEWTELSGKEYYDYIEDVIATCRINSAAANTGKDVPEKWFMHPYCPPDYSKWKGRGKKGGKGKP